jgi:flagellar motor switch/type III secretory pathway protein FliN
VWLLPCRHQAAAAAARTASTSGKEGALAQDLASARAALDDALADKAQLEAALGLLDRDSKAQAEQLQVRLRARALPAYSSWRLVACMRTSPTRTPSHVLRLPCTLQAELGRVQQELASLKEGAGELAAMQAQLAAANKEASGLRNDSEEVEYLQAQLRRTLRQVVELQRQVRVTGCVLWRCQHVTAVTAGVAGAT